MKKILRIKNKFLRILYKIALTNKQRILILKWMGVTIGRNVYIGDYLMLDVTLGHEKNLIIEDRVALATNVNVILESYPNFSKLRYYFDKYPFLESTNKIIRIKHDSWIGAGVIILPGITVGKCAIVGAGSVVTKDVEDYTIVAGVPAKFIKKIQFN